MDRNTDLQVRASGTLQGLQTAALRENPKPFAFVVMVGDREPNALIPIGTFMQVMACLSLRSRLGAAKLRDKAHVLAYVSPSVAPVVHRWFAAVADAVLVFPRDDHLEPVRTLPAFGVETACVLQDTIVSRKKFVTMFVRFRVKENEIFGVPDKVRDRQRVEDDADDGLFSFPVEEKSRWNRYRNVVAFRPGTQLYVNLSKERYDRGGDSLSLLDALGSHNGFRRKNPLSEHFASYSDEQAEPSGMCFVTYRPWLLTDKTAQAHNKRAQAMVKQLRNQSMKPQLKQFVDLKVFDVLEKGNYIDLAW